MPLRVQGECETAEGRGKVIRIMNANFWHPRAQVLVEMHEDGRRRWLPAHKVWEVAKR